MSKPQRWIAENLGCLALLCVVAAMAIAVLFAVALLGA
jgi:hypothetical protein